MMDVRVERMLASRVRVRKATAARFRLIAATLVQHVSVLVSLLMVIGYPHGIWFVICLVPCLWAGVAGGLLQFHLRERVPVVIFLGAMMLIPGVSLLVLAAVLYEASPVLAMARQIRATICPRCDYNLRGLPVGAPCPECGWREE